MPNFFDDYLAEYEAQNQRLDQDLPAMKAAVLEVLAAAGIQRATIAFDGSGDSGQTEPALAYDAQDAPCAMPETPVRLPDPRLWQAGKPTMQCALPEALDRVAWALIERHHDGWETDEGGYGEIVIDVAAQTITLEMNIRRLESDYHVHEF